SDDTLDPLRLSARAPQPAQLEFGHPKVRAKEPPALARGCVRHVLHVAGLRMAARRMAALHRAGIAALQIACIVAVGACSAAQSPGGGRDDEGRSLAEYDIARDLWLNRGQRREALDHVLEALELDDENAEAAHLAALIYLDF